MERKVTYPILEGQIAEKGIVKGQIAKFLNITPRTLSCKLGGKTEFTWIEVVRLQSEFFPNKTKDELMTRNHL